MPEKCTSCTKTDLFVQFSALVETSILTNNAYIRVDKFVVKGGPFLVKTIEKDVTQTVTIVKSVFPNMLDPTADADRFQSGTAGKSILADHIYAFRNSDTP